MGHVISISRLKQGLAGHRVAFDEHGDLLDIEMPGDIGPTSLVVAPVTDALKRLQGDKVESLDRDEVWAVEAIVLGEEVLELLDEGDVTVEELLRAVRELGYSWEIIPTSSP